MVEQLTALAAARETVIQLLTDQIVAKATETPVSKDGLAKLLFEGFPGFSKMSAMDLLEGIEAAKLSDVPADAVATLEAAAEQEILPGATLEEIGSVCMPDLLDYNVPEDVPAWRWIEREASFSHLNNGSDGIWEFVVNLSRELPDIPELLASVIAEARLKGVSYLVFHQGT